MAGNLAKWPSNRGLISKIRPSVGCKGNTVPSTVARGYDFRKPGGHLGNVGQERRSGLRSLTPPGKKAWEDCHFEKLTRLENVSATSYEIACFPCKISASRLGHPSGGDIDE